MIDRAISACAGLGQSAAIRRADHAHEWHFEVADVLVEDIVVRQIWQISNASNKAALQAEIDGAAMLIHDILFSSWTSLASLFGSMRDRTKDIRHNN